MLSHNPRRQSSPNVFLIGATAGLSLSPAPPLLSPGSTYSTTNCSVSDTHVPFAYEVGVCRPIPSNNATLPASFYARTLCPAQPTFASLTPKFVQLGSQTVRLLFDIYRMSHAPMLAR